MTTPSDDRLGRALRAAAGDATAPDNGWAAVMARAQALRGRHRRRRATAVLAAAAVVVAAVGLVRLGRGDQDGMVVAGDTPAALDPELRALAGATVTATDAIASEARAYLVDRDAVTAAQATTDAAVAAWRPVADRLDAARPDPNRRAALDNARARAAGISTLRQAGDVPASYPRSIAEYYGNLAGSFTEALRAFSLTAPAAGTVRQMGDAASIATLAARTPRLLAPATDYPTFPERDRVRQITDESAAQHAQLGQLDRQRRAAVAAVLDDRGLAVRLAARAGDLDAGRAVGPDPGLVAAAREHQDRLVALARAVLAEPTTAPAHVDPAVHRAEVALRLARDGELWATLVGDAAERTEARQRVDAALEAARAARRRSRLDPGPIAVADKAALVVAEARRTLDSGAGRPIDIARQLSHSGDEEADVLEAALEPLPGSEAGRADFLSGLVHHHARLTYATALALLALADAPAGSPSVDRALLAQLAAEGDAARSRTDDGATPDQRSLLRAGGHDIRAQDLISQVLHRPAPVTSAPLTWPGLADRLHTDLDGLGRFITDQAR